MLSIIYFCFNFLLLTSDYYRSNDGNVTFVSKATAEKIVCKSSNLQGVINVRNNNFSFVINLETFHGFNSELQKEHFKENYVESEKYPKALFSGKIIDKVDYTKTGIYEVRAKGNFELHGLSFNKIINATVTVINQNQIKILSNFQLSLKEFNIKIPRLVHKKVAESIKVNVDILMTR